MRDAPQRAPATRALGFVLALVAGGSVARADDVRGYVELRATESESEERVTGLAPTVDEGSAVTRRLYLSFQRQAFPKVRFWGGGTFEDNDVSLGTGAAATDTDDRRLRPYFGIAQRSGAWTTQLFWSRDQRRSERPGLAAPVFVRDGLFATLNWSPREERLPRVRLSATRSTDRDRARELRDSRTDFVDLDVRQRLTDSLRWSYRGTLNERDDRLAESRVSTTSHAAEIAYTEEWWDRRLQLNAEYRVTRRETTIHSAGAGDVDVPLFPFEGLFDRDDTPQDGTLVAEPRLVDDDTTTPTTIDLGLPPPGGDERPWGLGLDFGRITPFRALFVWLDRDLPPEIAATFVWQVWTSANNVDWTPRASVADAPYDEFLRRFEIRFPELAERYVKLVVAPLDAAVPDADRFPQLLVTELDAARVSDESGTAETLQRFNLDARARLLAGRDLYYEASADVRVPDEGRRSYDYSHGLFHVLPLAPEASLSTRVRWEESRDERRRDRALVYSSSLRVVPVERLQFTLSLSGREERVLDEAGGDQVSVFLYAVADLYEGLAVQLGAGRAYTEDPAGGTVESTQVNFGARIDPRSDLSLHVSYVDALSEGVSGDVLVAEIFSRAAEATLTYTPVPTVYVLGSYRLEWRVAERRDAIRRAVLSWAPFPRGALRLGLNYDESRRSLLAEEERVFGPYGRWNVNPRSYLEVSYLDNREVSPTRRFSTHVLSAILRWGF